MIRFFGALMMAPVTGAMGAISALKGALEESMPEGQPPVPPPPVQPAIQTPAGPLPGEWADMPLPPLQPLSAPAAVMHPEPPPPEPPPPRREIEFVDSPERKWKMDRDLNDDMNKLVRYSIVCVDRENETVLQGLQETLVRDRLDESGFTAWKILEFVQKMNAGRVDAPWEWEHGHRPEGVEIRDGKVRRIGGDPMKYLRVPFQVVDRYPRERFKYEEKQIDVLRQIERVLDHRDHGHHGGHGHEGEQGYGGHGKHGGHYGDPGCEPHAGPDCPPSPITVTVPGPGEWKVEVKPK